MKTFVAAFIISLVRFIGISIGIDIGMLILIGIDIGILIDIVLLTGIVMLSDIVLLSGIAMFSFAAKATPKESVKRMDASIIPINMLLFIFLPLIFLYELVSQMTFGQGFRFRMEKDHFHSKEIIKRMRYRDAGGQASLVRWSLIARPRPKLDFKPGLEADTAGPERCSAAKKVLEAVRDSPDLPRQQDAHPISYPLLQSAKSEASHLFQLLDTHLPDHGFPDLVRHPSQRALGFVHLHPFAREHMHLLRAPFAELDIRVASVGCLQAAWRGDLPVKTPISLPFSSRRAKFLISFSAMIFPSIIAQIAIAL